MRPGTMGSVLISAKIENLEDLHVANRSFLPVDQIRSVAVTEALVDTGATGLGMPKHLISQLGLKPVRTRRARTSAGPATVQIYGAVRLTIQDRDCVCDVTELPDDCPV